MITSLSDCIVCNVQLALCLTYIMQSCKSHTIQSDSDVTIRSCSICVQSQQVLVGNCRVNVGNARYTGKFAGLTHATVDICLVVPQSCITSCMSCHATENR